MLSIVKDVYTGEEYFKGELINLFVDDYFIKDGVCYHIQVKRINLDENITEYFCNINGGN